ncbi:MAG: signal peptidase I [Rickettsiales bacterium]|nr:signal peptidase I [Rickettsiales bacterium]
MATSFTYFFQAAEFMEDVSTQPIDKRPKPWDDTIKTVVIAVLLAVIFRSFLFEPFHIPSGSMKNNLLVGDYLFVSKYSYGYSRYSFPFGFRFFDGRIGTDERPKRGDVIVFRLPRAPRIDYIKRVIGLPGDQIQVTNGVLYINGNRVDKRAIDDFNDDEQTNNVKPIPRYEETLPEGKVIAVLDEMRHSEADDTGIFIVPEKHYFVMGDNRDNSRDSRFDEVGYIPEENIVGKAEIIVFSSNGSARWINPISWVTSLRFGRFFQLIH